MKDNIMSKKWGSEIIPKENWIDVSGDTEYTCGNKRVIGLQMVLHNSCGNEVTYPVKGEVIIREKPWKTEYRIWSLDGKSDIVFGDDNSKDLVFHRKLK